MSEHILKHERRKSNMNYIICNITIPNNSVADDIISRELKEIPYGIKTRIKNMKSEYGYVMVKVIDEECDKLTKITNIYSNNLVNLQKIINNNDDNFNTLKIFIRFSILETNAIHLSSFKVSK